MTSERANIARPGGCLTPSARARESAPCPWSSPSASAASPLYPAAGGYALPDDVALLASNESPDPPLPQVVEAITRSLTGLNRYPDPSYARLRRRWATATASREPHRDRQRLGRDPARRRRGAARARRGDRLRVAELQRLPAPRGRLGRPGDHRAARRPRRARPRRDGSGDHRRHAAGHRLQPEQPDLDGAAARPDHGVRREVPPHVALLLDEAYCEFNLLDDPDASIDLLERHPNLVLLRTFSKVYGLAGLRVGFALCGSEPFVQAVDQVRQPFFLNAAAQAAAIEALKHQDAVAERVERAVVARVKCRTASSGSACASPSRRRTSAGCTCPRTSRRPSSRAARAGRARARRDGARARGRVRVTYGRPEENDRFLGALAALLG